MAAGNSKRKDRTKADGTKADGTSAARTKGDSTKVDRIKVARTKAQRAKGGPSTDGVADRGAVSSRATVVAEQVDDAGPAATTKLKKKVYEEELARLQQELIKLQDWVKAKGLRVVVIFEGRDAAGKGGVIKRITASLNPRICRVVALPAPTEREKGQWYFQRYVAQLPAAGEMVLLDRSWYNRAGVERVMGFTSPRDYLEFMRQAPQLEQMLVRSGIRLVKLWFSVSRGEQRTRFLIRQIDPVRQWKLSPTDLASLDKWDDYTAAKEAMFFYTHTADAPWTVVKSNDKKRARLEAMRHVLHRMPYEDKDPEVVTAPDPLLVGSASEVFEDEDRSGPLFPTV